MTNSMFEEKADQPVVEEEVQVQEAVVDPVTELLQTIVDKDGRPKYSDVDTALKSIPHKESHIQTLESELAQLREEVEKRKTMEELMEAIAKQNQKKEDPDRASSNFDLDKVVELVDSRLAAKSEAAVQEENKAQVVKALAQVYGEKAQAEFEAKAKELGLGVATMEELSARSPKAVLSYFNLKHETTTPFSKSDVRVDATDVAKPKSSAKVPEGATTRDAVAAWRAAGDLI